MAVDQERVERLARAKRRFKIEAAALIVFDCIGAASDFVRWNYRGLPTAQFNRDILLIAILSICIIAFSSLPLVAISIKAVIDPHNSN